VANLFFSGDEYARFINWKSRCKTQVLAALTRSSLTIVKRSRRNFLGFFWVAMPYLVFISGIILFRQAGEGGDKFTLILNVGAFYLIYRFYADTVLDSTGILFANRSRLMNSHETYVSHVLFVFFTNFIETLFRLFAYIILVLYFSFSLNYGLEYELIPRALLMAIFLVSNVLITSLYTSLICLRFPDVAHIAQFMFRLSIFFSPLLLDVERLNSGNLLFYLVMLNPLTHLMLSFFQTTSFYANDFLSSNVEALLIFVFLNVFVLGITLKFSQKNYKHWLLRK